MTVRVEPLTYDDTPRKRRWSARWLVALGLATAALAGWRWWPVAWQRCALWFCAIQVRDGLIPPDVRVIDRNDKVIIPPPAEWINFYRESEGAFSRGGAVLFLANRKASNGNENLVEIGTDAPPFAGAGYHLLWHTFVRSRTGMLHSTAFTWDYLGKPWPRGVTYYSGVADPIDQSHFTIREICSNGSYGTIIIDGYLMNGGTVRLEQRPSSFSGRPDGAPVGRVPRRGDR